MIVVDSSAIIAIFLREREAPSIVSRIRSATGSRMSAANLLEVLIVLDSRSGADNRGRLEGMLAKLAIEIEPVTLAQVWLAGEAHRRFGKGRHPARLNFGDCFAYALARELDVPLLYKGDDFSRTDVPAAT